MLAANNPLAGRVTVVVAAAGYGKTRAVRAWLGAAMATWHRGPEIASPPRSVQGITVLDDAHLAPNAVLAAWLAAGHPVVLMTRRALGPAVLRAAAAPPVEIGPAGLALGPERTTRLLRRTYALTDQELCARIHRLTEGWPALVHRLGANSGLDPAELLADFLTAEVITTLPATGRRLLADACQLGIVCADLAATLGHPRPDRVIGNLVRLGLLVADTDPTWFRPVPVLAAVAGPARPSAFAMAADWHRRRGRPAEALRLWVAAGDHDGCVSIVVRHGPQLLTGGAAADVVAAIRALPAELRDDRVELLLAEGLEIVGDATGAMAVYTALAGDREDLPPALAWRYGVAVYLWGDPHQALDILRRGRLDRADTADEALLLAWTAAAHWLAGDAAACRDGAARAYRVAGLAGDDRARAAAHIALALAANLDGDPAGLRMNYVRALELAEAAGDVIQAIRIRANLAAGLEREANYTEALELVCSAVALAERCGHASLLAMSLCNEAALRQRLGQLDEAVARHQRAVAIYQRIGSDKVAYPLNGLGDIHRQRGRFTQARAAYEESVRAATRDGNRQGLVPALAGLARVVEGAAAAGFAAQAERTAFGPQGTVASIATGWVSLRAGDRTKAAQRAQAAVECARRHRDNTGLAEALELRAAASDPGNARQSLVEALAIWRDAAAVLDADRVSVALAALPGAREPDRLAARLAGSRLAAAGVLMGTSIPGASAVGPGAAVTPSSDGDRVRLRVLGQFTVEVDGVPLPASAWRSRKARDLLRILVTRRGRPVPRDELTELLWGESAVDPAVGHRLNVAVSTARGVLDPGRRRPPDHFIAAGPANLRVDLTTVEVDVETFLRDARDGLRLHADGAVDDALLVLGAAELSYVDDMFADDPYDEWAWPARDHARSAYLDVLRALTELSLDRGQRDEAVRRLRRILATEPYDERSHRALISVLVGDGRHGEARRAVTRYAAAMREIGQPPPDERGLLARRQVPA